MNQDEVAVLSANDSFYQAFAERNYRQMDELWSSERQVSCIHPGWTALIGRGTVMESWRAILRSESMRIQPYASRAFVAGDLAYVICFEGAGGEPPMLVATNIFAREGSGWRMVHHQAGQLATAPEIAPSAPSN